MTLSISSSFPMALSRAAVHCKAVSHSSVYSIPPKLDQTIAESVSAIRRDRDRMNHVDRAECNLRRCSRIHRYDHRRHIIIMCCNLKMGMTMPQALAGLT